MKKITLLTFSAVMAVSLNAQIELKSDGKKVEKLTCAMKQVDLRVYLPQEVKNYDIIDVQLYRHTDSKMEKITYETQIIPGRGNINYSNVYYKEKFQSWDYIDFKLIDGDKSDMSIGRAYDYSLSDICNYPLRDFSTAYNRIVIVGGVHNGWTYENGNKVKTYDFSTLKEYSFVHEIGAIDKNIYNPTFDIGMERLEMEDLTMDLNGDDNSLNYSLFVSEEGGGEMDFGAPPSEQISNSVLIKLLSTKNADVNTVKKGIEQQLIIFSNYYYAFSNYELAFQFKHFQHDEVVVYEGAVAGSNSSGGAGKGLGALKNQLGAGGSTEKTKETITAMLENPSPYFNWGKTTINGVEYEVLNIPVYDQNQTTLNSSKCAEIKSAEKNNSKMYKILIKEKNGVVYVAGIVQTGDAKLTELAKELITKFEKTLVTK